MTMRILNKVDDVKEFDGFKGKPHFGVRCSCGMASVSPLTQEQASLAELDPVIALRSLSRKEQQELADFWAEHAALGHELGATLCEIAPLKELLS